MWGQELCDTYRSSKRTHDIRAPSKIARATLAATTGTHKRHLTHHLEEVDAHRVGRWRTICGGVSPTLKGTHNARLGTLSLAPLTKKKRPQQQPRP